MSEVLYVLFILTIWFIVPYFLGTWLFKILKKRFRFLNKDKGVARVTNYSVFLLCALAGWFLEMLVLTGVRMCF